MVKLFVEGGGPGKMQKSNFRQGLGKFLKEAGLRGKMPQITPSGSRQEAYGAYCHELAGGKPAVLLVDSEGPVSESHRAGAFAEWRPWQHLMQHDNWKKPPTASDADCHLMVQCTESWFLADPQALKVRFGQGFQQNQLPKGRSLEDIPKRDVLRGLQEATRKCETAGQYDKGKHSFELLGRIDPAKVTEQSPWAKRFIDMLKAKMGA